MFQSLAVRLRLLLARLTSAPPATAGHDIIVGPALKDALGTAYRPFRTFSADGLALAGRDHGDAATALPPLLCVPGLSRNGRDFEPVAKAFAGQRRVVSVDLRGRGASEYSTDSATYNPLTEAQDVLAIIDRLGLGKPILLGTSRGGLVAMVIASLRSNPFSGVIFNDIGPAVELAGLLKIKSYVGRLTPPRTWDEAADWIASLTADTFPDLDRPAHLRMARRLFREVGGHPVADYDPKLADGLDILSPVTVLPQLWPQYAALSGCPILVLRGEYSDILSPATVTAMGLTHPRAETHQVDRQGHAPLLEDAPTLERIGAFLERCDRS